MSVLAKCQVKEFCREYVQGGVQFRIVVTVRYDDSCRNGYNMFSLTGTIQRLCARGWVDVCGGCIHEDIAKQFPHLAPYVKWHLCSSQGPMHYIANTLHHADEHGPPFAYVYYTGFIDPFHLADEKERLLGYFNADKAAKAEGQEGYRVKWNNETSKTRNLEAARSSAVWPDASDDDLTTPGLRQRLEDRLPLLLEEFKLAVEALGFIY